MNKQSGNRAAQAREASMAGALAISTVPIWQAYNLPGASYAQLPEAVLEALHNDGRLAAHSKATYHYALKDFWRWKGERVFSLATVEQYVALMRQRGNAVRTINKALAAVRWMARYLRMQALDDAGLPQAQREEIARQAERVADVAAVRNPNAELLAGRHVKLGEFDRLMDACIADKTPAGARDGAMFMLAWSTGLRVSELAALSMASIRRREGEGFVELAISGKGGKLRSNYIALDDGVAWALADWLDVRGAAEGALFTPVNKGGAITVRHLSRQALQLVMQQRVNDARLAGATTWHDFRRTFIGNRWSDNWDPAMLSRYVGHASSAQTVRYDRRPEEHRRNAALSLSFDYAGRKS